MAAHSYPVRVDATLEGDLSRWLWVVKWLLVIPHYFVLAFLWLALVVLSAVALVAILFTGRYPRAIYDFNVGVQRWSWRVAYYAYGGLGTDHYPPFSLEENPDYPAHLEIEYPERLSRGLVLVKWWLLAIPHYLVLALFLGAGWSFASDRTDNWSPVASGGLIGLLVFIAAMVLLFTGSYPRSIFDIVLGLNRWVLRVAAYAGLMTDEYPPFRLDLGGTDPGTGVLTMGQTDTLPPSQSPVAKPPVSTSPVPPPATPGRSHWGAGRIIAVIVGSVLALASLGLLAGGAVLREADGFARDQDGYLMSSPVAFASPGYAVTSESVELARGSAQVSLPERWLGTVKVEADARTPNGVFVGVGRTSDVEAYLAGVAHSTVVYSGGQGNNPTTTFTDGGSPAQAPVDETFWVASAQGTGQQTITWSPKAGDWTLVVMNGEGTTPVAADVAVGATVPVLGDVAVGLLISGLVLLVISIGVLFAALRRRSPV
jgi:hypothetical protein